jgi:hypothetical protein
MKTILKSIFFLFTFVLSIDTYAQIKVFSNNQVNIGTPTFTVPAFDVNLYGRWFLMGGRGSYTSSLFKCDTGNSDPRLWSPTGTLVFYNSDGVGVTGYMDIQVKTCYQYSDVNAKTNINSLTNSLEKIKKLRGVTYNWKTTTSAANSVNAKPGKLEYGLIAQEVEAVVPDLVLTNDSTQGKMLSYTGIIPLLIEALKELSAQVDDQKQQIAALKGQGSTYKSAQIPTELKPVGESAAALSQNVPNPFNQTTKISYFLPKAVQNSVLYIYDMKGLQIKSIPIQSAGNGSITINSSGFSPGMYIYTLVADGMEIDTKRMILTQ